MQGGTAPHRLVVAEGLIGSVAAKLGCDLRALTTLGGSELEGAQYRHPLSGLGGELDRQSPVVVGGDYITTDAGTGLVHTAPGHGIEDYQVGGPGSNRWQACLPLFEKPCCTLHGSIACSERVAWKTCFRALDGPHWRCTK